jgi:translation initiation factor 2 beta subunit (eIF-2beta)/eIF-5
MKKQVANRNVKMKNCKLLFRREKTETRIELFVKLFVILLVIKKVNYKFKILMNNIYYIKIIYHYF